MLVGTSAKRRQEVADALGVNEQSLYQIVTGHPLASGKPRGVGRQLREKLDSVYPEWLELAPKVEPLAHDMSQARNYPPVKTVSWRELPMLDLTKPFELEVIDGAFGEDYPAGCVMRLDPNRKPKAGWPLLAKDKRGKYYLRDYQQGAGESWKAVARVPRGFDPLDSVDDGLVVVAVMNGVMYP